MQDVTLLPSDDSIKNYKLYGGVGIEIRFDKSRQVFAEICTGQHSEEQAEELLYLSRLAIEKQLRAIRAARSVQRAKAAAVSEKQ